MIAALILLVAITSGSMVASDRVDLIEVNHQHALDGKPVFDQIIFWEWSDAYAEYHVREWLIPNDDNNRNVILTRRPGLVVVLIREGFLLVRITSSSFRESWTQIDPERHNKRLLAECLRAKLSRN
jgi:hypothetical protein